MPDFRKPAHLPNLRADRQPPHPGWLPAQQRGISPQMIGRYPDYDVLVERDRWDEATTKVVMARLEPYGPMQFFTAAEESVLRAFCDTVLAQDGEPRVPVAEFIDAKLAAGRLDGYQYVDMPDDRQTWQLALSGLDDVARDRYGKTGFADAEPQTREAIVDELSRGQLTGGVWDTLNASRAWAVCMRSVLAGFYSHPWAWNEIGFGGPAYPRGFMRLGPMSTTEPFEKHGATSEDPTRVGQDGQS